jgi:hypothetical protein
MDNMRNGLRLTESSWNTQRFSGAIALAWLLTGPGMRPPPQPKPAPSFHRLLAGERRAGQ